MLRFEGITAGYGRTPVVWDVWMEVAPGVVVGLVGPNGAGKSTLLRVATGLLIPTQGHILWQQTNLTQLPPRARARLVAAVPQGARLPLRFTVEQTVLLGRTPYMGWLGFPSLRDRNAVDRALHLVDLEPLRHRFLYQLSGGEQQRVLLARALAQETPILLLDEPTTHLDLFYQAHFLETLRFLARKTHRAVLIVLHDLNLAALYTDIVYLLHQGRVVASGPPKQVFTSERLSHTYGFPVQVHRFRDTVVVLPGKLASHKEGEVPYVSHCASHNPS